MHTTETVMTPQDRAIDIVKCLYAGSTYRDLRRKTISLLKQAKTENEITRILRNARLES
jgi:hypothetical protein